MDALVIIPLSIRSLSFWTEEEVAAVFRPSHNPFINQVSFFLASLAALAVFTEYCHNPFINQVSFFGYMEIHFGTEYNDVIIPLSIRSLSSAEYRCQYSGQLRPMS